MAYQQIKYEVQDNILTITLNRPDKMNAFTHVMMDELIAAFDAADADDNVRAIIVTGAGRAFCAGADLSEGGATFDRAARSDRKTAPLRANGEVEWSDDAVRDGGGRVTLRIFKSLKPVIGAINGAAVGIGATMTLAMDIRMVSEKARIGFVFGKLGIVPEACSSWFLPRLVGPQQALEWVLSAEIFDAAEALRGGPIDRSRILCVGDGVVTDVMGANAQALDCLFIAQGIHGDQAKGDDGALEPDRAGALLKAETAYARYAALELAW